MITKLFKIAFLWDHFTLLNYYTNKFLVSLQKEIRYLTFYVNIRATSFFLQFADLCENAYKMDVTKDCQESTTVNKFLWGRKKSIAF